MNIHYSISETDYLTHQLYTASKSRQIIKKRTRSKILFPLFYCLFALWGLFKGQYILAVIFFTLALIWYVFYPLWENRYYRKYYQTFIKENYEKKCGITTELSFGNDCISLKDYVSEGKIQTSEIEAINEIPSLILIKLKSGISIILPKDKIMDAEVDTVITRLKELTAHLNINYNHEPDWHWK